MLKGLDYFFIIFHTTLIVFNLFGWIPKKTRKLNLITLTLTGLSWFALGLFYGIGYCPITDWHWNVLAELGHTNIPSSYIQYLIIRITGISFNEELINSLTAIFYFLALLLSVFINFKQFFMKLKSTFFISISLVLFSYGCDDDIDILKKTKATPIVYCILDVQDSVHYLKLNKSVIGEDDAYNLISNPDSLYFDSVEVCLGEYYNNSLQNKIYFEKAIQIQKDPGVFPISKNSIYKVNTLLNENYEYKIEINIPNYETISTSTELIQDFKIFSNITAGIRMNPNTPFRFVWEATQNGYRYEVYLRYNYTSILENDTIEKEYLYPLNKFNYSAQNIYEKLSVDITKDSYLYFFNEILPALPGLNRYKSIDIVIAVATEEFYIYQRSVQPYSTFDGTSVFSNIQQAEGIFASRFVKELNDMKMFIN